MTSYRRERIADLLLGFLANEVQRLTDPRLELVTVTAVDVTPDLKIAWIYWTCPGDMVPEPSGDVPLERTFPTEKKREEVEQALRGASGFLRRRIADELDLRHIPALNFRYDSSAANASRIDFLLKKAGF